MWHPGCGRRAVRPLRSINYFPHNSSCGVRGAGGVLSGRCEASHTPGCNTSAEYSQICGSETLKSSSRAPQLNDTVVILRTPSLAAQAAPRSKCARSSPLEVMDQPIQRPKDTFFSASVSCSALRKKHSLKVAFPDFFSRHWSINVATERWPPTNLASSPACKPHKRYFALRREVLAFSSSACACRAATTSADSTPADCDTIAASWLLDGAVALTRTGADGIVWGFSASIHFAYSETFGASWPSAATGPAVVWASTVSGATAVCSMVEACVVVVVDGALAHATSAAALRCFSTRSKAGSSSDLRR
mmetsp:Transcript_76610/g.212858  ORF Transcript_76610/g.212858 Transcript_76610/m.212858 type:complete len:305 (-) Transcript_76610:683-1597(-)